MGVFDLARPLVYALDGMLDFLPPVVRLLLWAALAGLIGMAVYRWTSPQEKLQALKIKVREDRRAMANFDGEADEMWPVLVASLSSSLKHLGLTFGAALLAGLPVLMLISPIAQRYGPSQPEAGATIAVTAFEAEDVGWQWDTDSTPVDLRGETVSVVWPQMGQSKALLAEGRSVLTLPLPDGSAVIHKKLWWNSLFANPAGYLASDAPVEAIKFDLPQQQFIPFGPSWIRSWVFTFFVALIAVSVILKIWWKIE